MRLLALALLIAGWPQEPPAVWRRPLSVANHSGAALKAGAQIALKRPRHPGAIEVRYGNRVLPAWITEDEIWFRIAADLKDVEIDRGYELRYGGVAGESRPSEVFEFFDEPGLKPPDADKWQIDPALKVGPDIHGTAVTGLAEARSAHHPASLILRTPPGGDFVVDAEIRWDVKEGADLHFSLRLELDEDVKIPDEVRKRGVQLIAALAAEELATRDEAYRNLVQLGRPVVPQLVEAARGADAEVRALAARAIDAIHKKDPPSVVETGFSTETRDSRKLAWVKRVGPAGQHAELLARKGSETFFIRRSATGWTDAGLRKAARSVEVPGRTGRIRFDFWGGSDGGFGAVWITRVIVRKDAWGVEAILGTEERVR